MRMEEKTNENRISVMKEGGKRHFGRTMKSWNFNITLNFKAYLEGVGGSDVVKLSAPGACKQNYRH
jgi:hypothetical protein